MIDYLWMWSEFMVRWLHVVAGIAWIGSSFYFIALDLSLKPGKQLPDNAHGEAWQVHGGGFYNMVKYLVAPARMPDELTWFKWEAYTTWLSGFALLTIIYYAGAGLYMIDTEILNIEPWHAVTLSIGGIAGGWIAYDALCRSLLGRDTRGLVIAGFAFIVFLAWGYAEIFSARGAFVQIGVTIGTIMVANVAMVIIPGQKKVVAKLIAGEEPDPQHGARASEVCSGSDGPRPGEGSQRRSNSAAAQPLFARASFSSTGGSAPVESISSAAERQQAVSRPPFCSR